VQPASPRSSSRSSVSTEPFSGGCQRIDGVADYFRGILDNFDRRFDERAIASPPQITQTELGTGRFVAGLSYLFHAM
jgi:hypothetical protein